MPVVPYPQNEPSPEVAAAAALSGANQLMSLTSLLSHPMVGYGSITGRIAAGDVPGFSLVDHYLSIFDRNAQDISSKMSPAARTMFAPPAAGMRDTLEQGLRQHQANQRQVVLARAGPAPGAQPALYAGPAPAGANAFAPSQPPPHPVQSPPAPSRGVGSGSGPPSGGPPDRFDIGNAVEQARRIAGLDKIVTQGKDWLKEGLPRLAVRGSGLGAVLWEAFHADPAGAETSTYVFGPGRPSMPVRIWGHAEAEQRELQVRRNGVWQPVSPLKRDRAGNGFRILDPDRFARATGQKWDTIVEQATKDPDVPSVGFAISVADDAERRIVDDGRAAGHDAATIQSKIDAYRAARTPAGQGDARPRITREVIVKDLDNTIQPYLAEIRKLDPSAIIGYRGSLASGIKGPHKGGGPFDPNDFDIDLFIVSDRLANSIRPKADFRDGGDISQIRATQTALETELRKNSSFAGLRQGENERLTFRVFSRQDIWRLQKRGDVQTYFLRGNKE